MVGNHKKARARGRLCILKFKCIICSLNAVVRRKASDKRLPSLLSQNVGHCPIFLSCVYHMYAIRLDKTETANGQSIVLWLMRQEKKVRRSLVVAEGNDTTLKRHYHLFVEYYDADKKISAMRKMIERAFENRGNQKAVAVCKKPEQYITYILKDYEVLYKIGFTDEELEDYHSRSYHKKKKQNVVQDIIEQIKITFKNPTEQDMMDSVFNYYRVRSKPMDFRHMKNVFIAVKASFLPKEVYTDFTEFCWKK